MRKRLQQSQQERANRDNIRVLGGWIELIFWMLNSLGASQPISGGGSGVFTDVPTVLSLPPIPTTPGTFRMVFWTSANGGTGDNQPWWTYYGYNRWYPMKFSTLSGIPIGG